MLRIVGVQRGDRPQEEFVLLQNQGGLKINLRGHALIAEASIETGGAIHLFTDNEELSTGAYVLLSTGAGTTRWGRTRDGQKILNVYMNRAECIWSQEGTLAVLAVQHTFSNARDLAFAR